jgi:hypothetical protein
MLATLKVGLNPLHAQWNIETYRVVMQMYVVQDTDFLHEIVLPIYLSNKVFDRELIKI